MVSVIEDTESDDHAKCLVRKFENPHDKSFDSDKFECTVDKHKTVRHFIHTVAQYYNLDVDSFFLTLSSFKSDSSDSTEKPELVESDDRKLCDIGLVFGDGAINRFVLTDNCQHEESDQAKCVIKIHKSMKVYPLTVEKNQTAGDLFKKVFQYCQSNDINTDAFVLTFNSYDIETSTELLKLKITEDDTRLLSDIGVVYRQGVNNRFELMTSSLSDSIENGTSSKSCSPTQDIKADGPYSKVHSSVRRNGLDVSSVIENNSLESSSPMPMLALPTTSMLYNRSTERTLTGYRGLVNQAMTCYLNSLLQALYMTPEFRNALYKWKFDFNANTDESKSIPFQLQKLFLNLQTSPRHSVETTELTRSFGWDSSEAWQQHDVQELCRVMFDALEQEFKNTTHVDLINQLYQGKMIDYVKCQECGIEKSREDTFLDIPLPIRPFGSTNAYGSIMEALQGFTQPETLDGNNQYFCERCNKKCNAHKGLKFSKFPYIMTLHLMRFDFDYNTMYRIKLNDKVEFPLKLNVNGFISSNKNGLDKDEVLSEGFPEELFGSNSKCDDSSYTGTDSSSALDEIDQDEDEGIDLSQHRHDDKRMADLNSENDPPGPYIYELYAIMIHSGSASGGHYYAYIKDFKTDQWLCFNDQSVSVITMDDIERSFGGGPVRGYYSGQYTSSTNAYMLMYRQIDHRRNKNAMTQEEFPPHLKDLHNLIERKAEEDRQMKEKERDMCKVAVYLADSVDTGTEPYQFHCSKTTSVEQLKLMAIQQFKITKPCQLVIYNKHEREVTDNLEEKNSYLVCHLRYNTPSVLLLKVIETVDSSSLASPGFLIMKLFMINLDDNEEDIDVINPVEIEIEEHKLLSDLGTLLFTKFDISRESNLHFAMQSNSKPLKLENDRSCSSIFNHYVFVFIERRIMSHSAIMQKIKSIITRYENTILLQFVLPAQDTELLQELITSQKNKTLNGHADSISIHSVQKHKNLNILLEDCVLSTEDGNLVTSPEDMCVVANGCSSGDQSEDSSITDSERTIKGDEDYPIDSPAFENDPMKVYEHNKLDENWDGTEDDDDDNDFQLNEKYFFKTTTLPQEDNDVSDRIYAYVDKRMTVRELKDNLLSLVKIETNFFILRRYKSDTSFEELALPSSSLEELNNSDIVYITIGQALQDGEYRGAIFWPEPVEQTRVVMKKMFDWIITVGTSVLDTKKELLAKLSKTQNIDIPLERCRLRKKRSEALMRCYFNEEIWNEDIGQGWEMVILDLKDRPELELSKTKRLMFVNHVEENGSQQRLISEMEFVVDIASATSANTQLASEISKKLNISEDQLELGYTHGNSSDIIWKSSSSNASFSLSDDNTILFCRSGNSCSKDATQAKWSQRRTQRKERSLKIHTLSND
ncbi:ubiquitin carboxyl-terminal hydrolase 47 [Adelges cooleyi]|uniref:ubiquitin carboxyl-terminal hydrolase 47 n=1 Tax=Adelges cooleyi TaxID=133065 RepID=UPI0021805F0A|nr:ubiquitin carboxyl-terminal hydrolase 47 [Adelges cooleyi]XP_050432538.1 ubiquitin carboxyl-terminal hydrolase 47 [Adelges cooleyi]